MKNADYWKIRFGVLEEASNKYGLETYMQIEPAFDSAQRDIQKEIEAWYGRYARNNGITMQEARKQLSTKELKEFRWDVNEYIKRGRENALNQQWMKELENASARVHVSRLEALKIRTQQFAEVAFGNELDCIDAMARNVFTEDYYHSVFELQKGFGIGWEIGQIDPKKLDKFIKKPWALDGKHFSERIWQQRGQLVSEIHQQLTRTCILGKAPDDAIKAISKKFGTTKSNAGRLVMTEQAYFHSVAQQEAFTDLDVEEFEIVATLDAETSEICQEMDGKHLPMSTYEAGVTAPPFHPWCRSVTVPYFEDNFTGERAARNADGETYYVPDNMTYKEWKKGMVDGDTSGLKPVIPEPDTIEGLQKQVDGLKDQLSKKKDEIRAKNQEIMSVNNEKREYQWNHKPEFDTYDGMSKDDLKKRVEALRTEESGLQVRYSELEEINDRWYSKPDRNTPEYQEWKDWKSTVDFDDFYGEMTRNQARQSEITQEIRSISDYETFKKRFGNMTEQDFTDKVAELKSTVADLHEEQKAIQKEIDRLTAKQAALKYGISESDDEFFNEVLIRLHNEDVEYNPVKNNNKPLTNMEIIDILSGGDLTGGSCASVGLAYIGQRQGWNVRDFRGGKSQSVFSSSFNLQRISQMKGMKVLKAEGASAITVGNRLLKQCEIGKEYYLCVGRHAAIVRAVEDCVTDAVTGEVTKIFTKYQYLELQSARRSGWIDFDGNPKYTLKTRFGCSSVSNNAAEYDFMLDIDESNFADNDDFKSLLGFLNTAVDAQRKGSHGTIK